MGHALVMPAFSIARQRSLPPLPPDADSVLLATVPARGRYDRQLHTFSTSLQMGFRTGSVVTTSCFLLGSPCTFPRLSQRWLTFVQACS